MKHLSGRKIILHDIQKALIVAKNEVYWGMEMNIPETSEDLSSILKDIQALEEKIKGFITTRPKNRNFHS